ncbi:MAG: 2-keto-4-pentenoate hydratase/2-oxohepta-3-ene-1,7-dioic acid hydratase in catechol pathway [Alphaproteobacteria bacterium]|jgi:2-keto-4-pentenoate hydratase/2-oxohepta-3-ene-1,7-dioic acid hydratase in catechol pathway
MRLVTFLTEEGSRIGALIEQDASIIDFESAHQAMDGGTLPGSFSSMLSLIDGGPAALDQARALVDRVVKAGVDDAYTATTKVKLCAPLPNPRRLRDVGCFLQHFRNTRIVRYRRLAEREEDPDAAFERFRAEGHLDLPPAWEAAPVSLNSNTLSIIGNASDIIWPHEARRMDYELEWAIVTQGTGSDIVSEQASAHIFGYTIFNDVSARDIQAQDMRSQLGLGGRSKDFDTGNVLGPCIVTADEFADPYNLTMIARVNGEEWSRGNTNQMDHRFEDVLAHVSRSQTVYPGEVFGSGTVPTGCGLEHNRFLEDGDVIELEVEGIGVLRNRIAKPADWRDRASPDEN